MEDGDLVGWDLSEVTRSDDLTRRPKVGAANEEDVSKMLMPKADGDVQRAERRRGLPANRVPGCYAVAKASASQLYIGTVGNQELDGSIIALFCGDMKRRPKYQSRRRPKFEVPGRRPFGVLKRQPNRPSLKIPWTLLAMSRSSDMLPSTVARYPPAIVRSKDGGGWRA